MGHTPYGYRIENGKAVIDEEKAAQVRMIFTEYLSGTALCPAARKAGLSMTHSSVKHLLTNSRYLGNDFYPAIIDEDTFLKAVEQLKARAQMLGRDNRGPRDYRKPTVPMMFYVEPAEKCYDDPFEQAAYRYSRIKEVKDGAG
jgi:hypothetical protein